jgi:hypothetical protein
LPHKPLKNIRLFAAAVAFSWREARFSLYFAQTRPAAVPLNPVFSSAGAR